MVVLNLGKIRVKEIDTIHRISPEEFSEKWNKKCDGDRRKKRRRIYCRTYRRRHSKPLAYINDWVNALDNNQHFTYTAQVVIEV